MSLLRPMSKFTFVGACRPPQRQPSNRPAIMNEVRIILDPKKREAVEIYPRDTQLAVVVRELNDGKLDVTLSFSQEPRCGKAAPPTPDHTSIVCELESGHEGRHQVMRQTARVSWADGDREITLTS